MNRQPLRTILLLTAIAVAGCARKIDLPQLYPVPDASLVAESGKPVRLSQMKGNVTVYDFIYTSCGTTCPIMTEQMRQLTQKIDKDDPVRFVSITVDPVNDTPARLTAYAAKFRNDPRWTFLTGDRESILRLSVEGFKLAASPPQPGSEQFLHSTKFAIADKTGMIREYYGSTDGDAADHVAETVKQLLRE
jgi:protein SCO1/2